MSLKVLCVRACTCSRSALELAKVLARKWQEEGDDAIPAHRLFPQMLDAASQFTEEHVTPVKTRTRQGLAINPYFGKAVAMLGNAMGLAGFVVPRPDRSDDPVRWPGQRHRG